MESARCKAFLSAAENGSFSGAAQELSYTTSGVSQLVTALEKEVGFLLFHRTRKGVSLTSAGETLLPAVRSFLQQEERMMQLAAQVRGLAVGEFTIGAYSSIASHWLPRVIKAFQEDFPQIHIQLLEGVHQEVMEWLDESRADIGFLSYKKGMAYEWIPLAEDRMLAVLPPEHPLAGAESFPIERCGTDDFIMPAFGQDVDVDALFEAFHIRPKIRFSTLENYAAMSMIESGLGISVMNELITKKRVSDVAILPLDPPQSITLGIALPSLSQASPAVQKFTAYAVRMLTKEAR